MFTRRQLLAAMAASTSLSAKADTGTTSSPKPKKKLVMVFATGGWDVTYAFDPKAHSDLIDGPEFLEDPNDPLDINAVETIHNIPLMTNPASRPAVTQFFRDWGQQTKVVNGIWTGTIAHRAGRYRMLSGTSLNSNPDFLSIVGAELGADLPLGSVDTTGFSQSGYLSATSGRVGFNGQLKMLLDPKTALNAPASNPLAGAMFNNTNSERDLISDYLANRAGLLAEKHHRGQPKRQIEDYYQSATRADRLRGVRDFFIEGLDFGKQSTMGTLIEMTVDLLAADVCQAVFLDSGLTWDTHEAAAPQNGNYQTLFTHLDQLLTELTEANLLEDTLVLVTSEMSRTPRYNLTGGKDHWGHTAALVMGGGVRGGNVVGGTNDLQESLKVNLNTGEIDEGGELNKYDNFNAGLLEYMGIDPEKYLPGVHPFRGIAT